MNAVRPVLFHASVLVVGALAASLAWSKEKKPLGIQEMNVTVWGGRPADLQRIVYESRGRKLELQAREEKKGERWFLGTSHPSTPPLAGSDGGAAPVSPTPAPPPTVFASSTPAEKLAEAFAPLRALRGLGKLPEARAAEFGLEKRDVALRITVAGKEHQLFIGSAAPGGSDTYALEASSGELFVLKGDSLRDLDSGESRLMEHDQHTFKETDTTEARVSVSGKTRELTRGGPDNKKVWADKASPDKADETAGNWMQKIDRLRVSEYAPNPPENRNVVVRVDYSGSSGALGYFELLKTPPSAEGQKPDYWIMTEHTHLYGKVFQPAAEQVEQDVSSVVK